MIHWIVAILPRPILRLWTARDWIFGLLWRDLTDAFDRAWWRWRYGCE